MTGGEGTFRWCTVHSDHHLRPGTYQNHEIHAGMTNREMEKMKGVSKRKECGNAGESKGDRKQIHSYLCVHSAKSRTRSEMIHWVSSMPTSSGVLENIHPPSHTHHIYWHSDALPATNMESNWFWTCQCIRITCTWAWRQSNWRARQKKCKAEQRSSSEPSSAQSLDWASWWRYCLWCLWISTGEPARGSGGDKWE